MPDFVGYGPNGEYRKPVARVIWDGAPPPRPAVETLTAPKVFPFGLGYVPQVPIPNYEAILSPYRGGA